MYLSHFALTRFPFADLAHPDELFLSQSARETETRLQHLIELRGIGLLTGEAGCGKTSLCRPPSPPPSIPASTPSST